MLIRLGVARFSILLGCFLVSVAPACGGRTGDDLESDLGAGGSSGTGDTSGGGDGHTASGGVNRGGDGGTSGGISTCGNPSCQDCRDCVSACTCVGNDYQYCANICDGAAGARASGGKSGQGGQGGQGGISAVGGSAGSQSCDARCPSVVIPTVGTSLSGCCLPDASCGVATDYVAQFVAVEGGCQSYNQVGYFNGQCPAAASPVGGPLEGCCRPDGTCGNDLSVLGLGCVRGTAGGGSVNRCDPFATSGTGGTGGVGTGGTAGAAGAVSTGGGPSVEECLNNAQSDCERCACKSCNASLDPCFKDAGCPLILQCANETKCSGTDCYQPSTCQSVIDKFGGLTSVSLNLAAPLFQCVRGCGCGFASP